MKEIPQSVTESVRRRNPHLYPTYQPNGSGIVPTEVPLMVSGVQKRVRQSEKPLMNKLETDWFNILSVQFPNYPRPRAQAKTYRLANGVRYTPDFTASSWPCSGGPARETAWEVKGQQAWDDAMVKVKVAASTWPEVQWILVWKQDSEWQQQVILP